MAIKRKSDDYNAWVIQHVARPVLKIEKKNKKGETMENSFGFAQSIAYMKELPEAKLSKQDLFDAYSIAGKRFGPEIGHYFVLMDWETAESMSAARNKSGKKHEKKQKRKQQWINESWKFSNITNKLIKHRNISIYRNAVLFEVNKHFKHSLDRYHSENNC